MYEIMYSCVYHKSKAWPKSSTTIPLQIHTGRAFLHFLIGAIYQVAVTVPVWIIPHLEVPFCCIGTLRATARLLGSFLPALPARLTILTEAVYCLDRDTLSLSLPRCLGSVTPCLLFACTLIIMFFSGNHFHRSVWSFPSRCKHLAYPKLGQHHFSDQENSFKVGVFTGVPTLD